MNNKILFITGAIFFFAVGGLILDSLNDNRGHVDPKDEPATLSSDFVIAPTGGGTFNIGEPIKAGFTMTHTGDLEGKEDEESRFFADEVTVFASSNNEAISPHGKAIVPVNGTANMNGEVMNFYLTGYTCAKEGDVSIIFRNVLTRYDIAGEPQTDQYQGRDQFYGGDVYVAVKCEEGGEMIQIEPPRLVIPAGTAPLGENEAETGFLHSDGNRYYDGERVDNEGTIMDDLENE